MCVNIQLFNNPKLCQTGKTQKTKYTSLKELRRCVGHMLRKLWLGNTLVCSFSAFPSKITLDCILIITKNSTTGSVHFIYFKTSNAY